MSQENQQNIPGLPGVKAPYDLLIVFLCLLLPAIIIYKAFDRIDASITGNHLFHVTSQKNIISIKNSSDLDFLKLKIRVNDTLDTEYNQVFTRLKTVDIVLEQKDIIIKKIDITAFTPDQKSYKFTNKP